jgi:hypothetical protein
MNGLLYVRSVRGRLCGGSGILLGWVIIAAFFGFFYFVLFDLYFWVCIQYFGECFKNKTIR